MRRDANKSPTGLSPARSTATTIIEGSRTHDIQSFYDEVNRVFMADEDWQLGPSLDALNDLLYGGYGAMLGAETLDIVWRDIAHSREALGHEATRAYYLGKIAHPDRFDVARFRRALTALDSGTGPTYFDLVMQIIAEHPNIRLIAE